MGACVCVRGALWSVVYCISWLGGLNDDMVVIDSEIWIEG